MSTLLAELRDRQRSAEWRRVAAAYATDLGLCLALVLIIARLLGGVGTMTPQTTWTIDLHAAVARFTPFGLWEIYRDQAVYAITSLSHRSVSGPGSSMLAGLEVLLQLPLAVPATLDVIWRDTDNASGWATLIGFVVVAGGAFVLMANGGRLSPIRLLLAVVASPLAAAGLFWAVQHTVLDLLDGFDWFAAVAPWFLLCPIICTLYWIVFPQASQGAAAAALERIRTLPLPTPRARQRRMQRPDLARTRPRK
jgi:hypothetical protein